MGFLRLYLALCVVNAHTGNLFPWLVPRGRHAVELFFIISGFYMAMVLSQRYNSVSDFYKSRWQRIAVPYYVHLVLIVLASVVCGIFFSQWLALAAFASNPFTTNGPVGILAASATNLTIFGQDAVLFFRDNAGEGFRFTPAFASHPEPLYRFLVMPQCWSVSIELAFYAIVPFLNRWNSIWLGGLLLLSSSLRFITYGPMGMNNDPWIYRFFPFELTWFLSGMLGWRLLDWVERKIGAVKPPGPALYGMLCAAVVGGGCLFR
jgi:peptidoglycan/LPS O-acetylase OafA/YrhL